MRRRGIFTLLMAIGMVVAFSAVSFAAQNVVMKTTTPNIPRSACYQVGTDTLEIDANTKMREGDVIQFTVSNGTTICKAIDMFLAISAVGGTALDDISDNTAPVVATDPADTLVNSAALLATERWGFLIQATAGSQVIRMTLRVQDTAANVGLGTVANQLRAIAGAVTMTFNTAASASPDPTLDRLFIKLFDGKWVGAGASGFYVKAAVPVTDVYPTALTAVTGPGTNALCLNTLTYTFPDVENTYDSIINPATPETKLSFSGDFRIAHILGTSGYAIVPCPGKTETGHIDIGAQGQPDTCDSFKFELADTAVPQEYCAPYNRALANRLVIAADAGTTFTAGTYQVRMDIVVERAGVAKATPGVYWAASAAGVNEVAWRASTTLANACTGAPAAILYAGGAYDYRRADLLTAAGPRASAAANCDLLPAEKAVRLTTPVATAIVIPATTTHLYIDMPYFNYDPAEVAVNDVVKVRVTLIGTGCTQIGPMDITIGIFGCTPAALGASSCTFPYFTGLTDATWWNGIVLVNKSDVAGNVALTAYKATTPVSTATATIALPARGVFVDLLDNIAWTGDMPSGVATYIEATSTDITVNAAGQSRIDGFAMMGNELNHDSVGYICRTPGN